MVGVGFKGSRSILARVSLVNFNGHVLYDEYVKPVEKVTDYRTWISGIKPHHISNAPDFKVVQSKVAEIIKDRILIGHAISNDLQALMLTHPRHLIRDTSIYKPFKQYAKGKHPSLRSLARHLLGLNIQDGSHCSVEDAKVTMMVYKKVKKDWEANVAHHVNGKGKAMKAKLSQR
jgi:RNA exonuclease 4